MTDAESELRDRVTVRVPPAFIDGFDTLVDGGYYRSHAAVCRAAMRRFLIAHPAVDIPSADLDVELATGGNENVPDGTVAKELAEADPDDLMTDGGQDTPLAGQERCRCGRLVVPEWDYCPACGRGLDDVDQNVVADGSGIPLAGEPVASETRTYALTLASGHEEYREVTLRERLLRLRGVREVREVDHRLDGAEPDDQPADPPWEDDEGGDER